MAAQRMEERSRRIVESAIELAEKGGFEAVRVRDIAAHAGVALGTLYKRFSSKEDILVAVLEREVSLLEQLMRMNPARGETPRERLRAFFEIITRGLFSRVKLARAALRATASGDPELTEKVRRFHGRIQGLIRETYYGPEGESSGASDVPAETVDQLCFHLSQAWFVALVGWMGGLFDDKQVVEQVRTACDWLLRGMPR